MRVHQLEPMEQPLLLLPDYDSSKNALILVLDDVVARLTLINFSVDLKQPYRLIFEPTHDPLPRKDDGSLEWSKVTSIKILEVTNTHE